MQKEILIQAGEDDTKVAVIEEGRLVEIYFERYQKLVGNIYKAKVVNILPGMQAAFVDIGIDRNAFLYGGDVYIEETDSPDEDKNIEHLLQPGQEIIVQVTKEPLKSKGPRVTAQLTLPGRHSVLMPNTNYVGVSRKIENEIERERLREIANYLKPDNMGLIIRTAAEGITSEELEEDVRYLEELWKDIVQNKTKAAPPVVLHKEVDLVERIVRDSFNRSVDKLKINDKQIYKKVFEILGGGDDSLKGRIFLNENQDIFATYNVTYQVMQALKHRVWLKSGGFLIIEQMEALTAIDVNTGKYIGSKNLEETVLRTNVEAAVEVARQLRLRNVGGIVIIDFIDMNTEEDKQKVIDVLEQELQKDKTRTRVLGITELGLLEMTRKKAHQALEGVLLQNCPYCKGKGKVLSQETVSFEAKHRIAEYCESKEAPGILVRVHPQVASVLIEEGSEELKRMESSTGKYIIVKGDEELHVEDINIEAIWSKEVKEESIPVKEGQRIKVKIEDSGSIETDHGISKVDGFLVDVEGAASLVNKEVLVEIVDVQNTFARAQMLENSF